jgi:hypothetical protein
MHRILTFVILAGCLASSGDAQDSVTISSDPKDLSRPISTLLDQLRKREKIAVTYEDPRYSNSADIQDVTSEVARNLSPAEEKFGRRILVPHGKAITFVYASQDMRSPEGAEAVIERLLREYQALGGQTFTVRRDGARLHVVPSDLSNAAGDRVKQESILDTVISIPPFKQYATRLRSKRGTKLALAQACPVIIWLGTELTKELKTRAPGWPSSIFWTRQHFQVALFGICTTIPQMEGMD